MAMAERYQVSQSVKVMNIVASFCGRRFIKVDVSKKDDGRKKTGRFVMS